MVNPNCCLPSSLFTVGAGDQLGAAGLLLHRIHLPLRHHALLPQKGTFQPLALGLLLLGHPVQKYVIFFTNKMRKNKNFTYGVLGIKIG